MKTSEETIMWFVMQATALAFCIVVGLMLHDYFKSVPPAPPKPRPSYSQVSALYPNVTALVVRDRTGERVLSVYLFNDEDRCMEKAREYNQRDDLIAFCYDGSRGLYHA